ncbi:MAG: DUF5633 domain-containing protein [Finegoldia magna]|uniref:DUF5633 domain-containing protein n=1 Tax=Finegoldia magna TaxID=1260 RepID=UPI0039A1C3B0
MAALAGAIVVGGGVNTYAADVSSANVSVEESTKLFREALDKADEFLATKDKNNEKVKKLKNEIISYREGIEATGISYKDAQEIIDRINSKIEEIKKSQEENNENGYSTKEAAEAAAKKALEKDFVNNAYDVEKNNDGKWYYTLKIGDSQGKQPSNTGKTKGKQPSNTGKTKNNSKKAQQKNKSKQNKNQKVDKKLKKQTKEKKKLPKAGNEAEILTLAAASLSSVAGAFISLKKRK